MKTASNVDELNKILSEINPDYKIGGFDSLQEWHDKIRIDINNEQKQIIIWTS